MRAADASDRSEAAMDTFRTHIKPFINSTAITEYNVSVNKDAHMKGLTSKLEYEYYQSFYSRYCIVRKNL